MIFTKETNAIIPKISKIVLNMGVGEAKDDAKLLDKAVEDLTSISGQKAVKTKANCH